MMKTMMCAALALATLSLSARVASAEGFTRIGPNGGSATVSRSYDNGVYRRDVDRVGPHGATASVSTACGVGGRVCATDRSGMTADGGHWSGSSASVARPHVTRRYATFTGPDGNTYNTVRVRRW